MLRITGFSVLIRAGAELPPSLIIKRDELTDGWSIVGPGGAKRLEKRIRSCRWHSFRIADESLRSGVGESSQQAIVCALKLVVRGFSDYFNAVEVRHIHLTEYPWFVLAKVGVYPYRIQQSPVQLVPDDALPLPARARRRRSPVNPSLLFPQFGREIPTLKEMLIQSGNNYRSAQ
jgi:hypothetical protein